jgi:hypothetical protein
MTDSLLAAVDDHALCVLLGAAAVILGLFTIDGWRHQRAARKAAARRTPRARWER